MDEVGLRELRQNASDLVRRVQSGESMTITVAGRPAALLGPVRKDPWRTWEEVADVLSVPMADDGWEAARDLIDQEIRDPWERA